MPPGEGAPAGASSREARFAAATASLSLTPACKASALELLQACVPHLGAFPPFEDANGPEARASRRRAWARGAT
jgi:hypothetical protein